MNQLNLLNHVIANCDEALVEAFVRRMDISSEVAKAKLSMDEKVYDSKTEREYIQHVVSQFSPELSLKANSLWYSLLRMDRGQQFRWILKHTESIAPAHEALITDSLPEGPVACIDKYADEASQLLGCDVIRCASNDEALQMLKDGKVARTVLGCDKDFDLAQIYLTFYNTDIFMNASARPNDGRSLFFLSKNLVVPEDCNRMTLAFAVDRHYGSLTQALSTLAEAKLNIENMRLRRKVAGDGHPDDLIFIDLSGDFNTIDTRTALYQFENEMYYFRLLGFWNRQEQDD